MKPRISLVMFVPAIFASAVNGEGVPAGLSAPDWTSIRAAYETNRHAAFAVEGGYQARNPGQQWTTRFDCDGFESTPDAGVHHGGSSSWSWGLELVSYGIAGGERPVSAPACMHAIGQRVEREWNDNLTEWYINDQRGLEHGYTLHRRPDRGSATSGALNLTLAVRGGLQPQVTGNGQSVSFLNASGASVVNYNGLKVFDATGALIPAWFEPGDHSQFVRLTIDESNAIYPLTIDPIAQQAYLKASNTGQEDRFGNSVAVSGDTAVVGAPWEGSNATGVNGDQANNAALASGAVYVFVRSGTVWTQQAYLKASNTQTQDVFGTRVAISGDTIVVSAPSEGSSATGVNGNQADNSAGASGAAYIFVRNSGVWTQQAYLKASNTAANDQFGESVAISGDLVVVGAWAEDSSAAGVNGNQADNSASDSGAAYVFVRNAGIWSQQAYLKASNTAGGDYFGYSVAANGDTVVVGARFEDSNATGVNGNEADNTASSSGAAFVFVRSGGVWSQQAYLKSSNTEATDLFGHFVAISGDTVVVGAPAEDSNATGVNGNQANNSVDSAGAAYVFFRNGGLWNQQAYLKASNTGSTSDSFGLRFAVSGDTIVVGALSEDSNATGIDGNQSNNSASNSGAAYVFVRSGGAWSQLAYLKASNTAASDGFSTSVAISGDTVMISAIGEDSNATGVNGDQANNSIPNSGAVYVFTLDASPDADGDGVPDASDVCPNTAPGLPVNAAGRPLSDLNSDCIVNGLDIATYVDDPSVRPMAAFVADLLL